MHSAPSVLHVVQTPALSRVSVLVPQQNSIGEPSLSRITLDVLPVIVRTVQVVWHTSLAPSHGNPPPADSGGHFEPQMQAEGESPVDNWQLPARHAVEESGPLSGLGSASPASDVAFVDIRSRGDRDFVSASLLGASAVNGFHSRDGLIELSNGSAHQAASTTGTNEPSQNQAFLLSEPTFDGSPFSYALEGDWTNIDSEDLIDLIELLGDDADADAEGTDDQQQNDATAAETTSGDATDDEANTDANEQVFATWPDEVQRGMIELDRRQGETLAEASDPEVEGADAKVSLYDLTLELEAVIGSARTFEWGDAQREMKDDATDVVDQVESQPASEAHDEPQATHAAFLPLIASIAHRRVRKSKQKKRLAGPDGSATL